MKYLLVSILCLLGLSVNGQITQRNIEIVKTDNNSDVFGINNIDSITYEYDEILDTLSGIKEYDINEYLSSPTFEKILKTSKKDKELSV